ncbi:MAG TPA: hypothetical protein PLR06_09210 [Cyclobacteriaceae bacterium]|nr:hypothetical protein [Cyclobacteriaceae bacterium]
MFKKYLILVLMLGGVGFSATAQKTVYTTTGGEWIFSEASVSMANGKEASSILRFSPVFNFQTQVHRDFNNSTGLMTGIALRNVGFIYDDPNNPGYRYKARTYNIGIPIALKFGKMDGKYFFFGYEIEFPINYKEKQFKDGDKQYVRDYWFSSRVPTIYNTLFAGVQMQEGVQLKFKYYATPFFDKTYQWTDASGATTPYPNGNVFYFSLSFQILKGTSFVYKHKE